MPDPGLQRDYDIKVKLKMSSVRYVHTNRFQSEFVAFLQHFLQLQDVLGRMRAASAGKKVHTCIGIFCYIMNIGETEILEFVNKILKRHFVLQMLL